MLDMFDRRNVKVTSHMVGAAVEKHAALAKEIVQRGDQLSFSFRALRQPLGVFSNTVPAFSLR